MRQKGHSVLSRKCSATYLPLASESLKIFPSAGDSTMNSEVAACRAGGVALNAAKTANRGIARKNRRTVERLDFIDVMLCFTKVQAFQPLRFRAALPAISRLWVGRGRNGNLTGNFQARWSNTEAGNVESIGTGIEEAVRSGKISPKAGMSEHICTSPPLGRGQNLGYRPSR